MKFLKCMREAGLSIQVLQEYIALYNQGDKTREERRNLLISQRDHLIEKKACIQKSIEQLNHKIENDEELLNKHI